MGTPVQEEPAGNRFRELMAELVAKGTAIAPEARHEHYDLRATIISDLLVDVECNDRAFLVDEPLDWGGDLAPNPADYFLGAIASSIAITYRLHAAAMGIELANASVRVSGGLDLMGFLDLDDSVRAGFGELKCEISLDAPTATDEQLDELNDVVRRRCPMIDAVREATPMSFAVRTPREGHPA